MRRLLLAIALLTGTALFTPSLHAEGYAFFTLDYPAAGPNISTTAFGINNLGQIVGSYSELQKLATHGFLFENGTFTTIDLPNSQNTEAHGINDIGTIVGQTLSSTAGGCERCMAFIESYRAAPATLREVTAAAMPADLQSSLLAALRARLREPS